MKNCLKILLSGFLISIVAYTYYDISKLSSRIQKIENKLGGPGKIACTEKKTIERVRRSVVRIVGGESEGSGFAICKDGFILTNFHVIESEPSPKVILSDGTFETGQVIMADKDSDLAFIKISKGLPLLILARLDEINPAEEVFSIGYPLGGDLPGEASVIRGSFSRFIKDKKNGVKYIATDMTFISGISGGPMVNIYGEVIGINTIGLSSGGLAMAISADSIIEKYSDMQFAQDPLKDVKKIVFEPNKNALEVVRCFYNYLKARRLETAFGLLSDNFLKGGSFKQWSYGYRPLLDTTIILIKPDRQIVNRVNIKLSTKDLVGDEIICKYFEGYWDVRRVCGKWLLWKPKIREVESPGKYWFLDQDIITKMEELAEIPENGELTLKELYEKAKGIENSLQAAILQSWPG